MAHSYRAGGFGCSASDEGCTSRPSEPLEPDNTSASRLSGIFPSVLPRRPPPDMERIEKTVFLSYRRTNAPWALAIFQSLTHHGYDVFFDFSGVASGDFERVIIGNIKARAHFLVLLTPSALERCGEPGDWLRREIETALDTQRNIVPLMLEGFDFGAPGIASGLTGTLAPLKHYNALRVPVEYFDEAMQRLRDRYLNVALDAVLHPASPFAQQAAKDEQVAAGAAPAVTEKELTAQEWFERGLNAADLDEKLRLLHRGHPPEAGLCRSLQQPGHCAQSQRRPGGRAAGLRRGHPPQAGLCPRLQQPGRCALCERRPGGRAAGLSTRPSASSPTMPKPSQPGPCAQAKATWRARCRITIRPSASSQTMPKPSTTGACAQAKGDMEGALQDYDEAIRLKPDYAEAFNNRGNRAQSQRRPGGRAAGFRRGRTPQVRTQEMRCGVETEEPASQVFCPSLPPFRLWASKTACEVVLPRKLHA